MPGIVDMGAWRTALFAQVAAAWGGPDARVRRVRNRYGGFVLRGDVLRFCGRVTQVRRDTSGGEIDVGIWNDKSDGSVVTTGSLTVCLPARPGSADPPTGG